MILNNNNDQKLTLEIEIRKRIQQQWDINFRIQTLSIKNTQGSDGFTKESDRLLREKIVVLQNQRKQKGLLVSSWGSTCSSTGLQQSFCLSLAPIFCGMLWASWPELWLLHRALKYGTLTNDTLERHTTTEAGLSRSTELRGHRSGSSRLECASGL